MTKARLFMAKAGEAFGNGLGAITSPASITLVLLLASCATCVAGVYELAGRGWALVSASAWLFVVAAALAKGNIRAS